MRAPAPLLDVQNLSVEIRQGAHALRVVDDISLSVARGEVVGLVGESGSGKSMTAFAIMNLFPSALAHLAGGRILLEGRDLATLAPTEMRAIRGARIGMVFQDPTSYLDPLMPVGRQIAEALRAHGRTEGLHARVLELLDLMELPQPAQVFRKYPHELSGGMRQRILIAAALAMRPSLLIADEPTTALDVTVQSGILKLLVRLQKELELGILLITHDLAVVNEVCQRVHVMYAGQIVESNAVAPIFASPRHPYTQGLLGSILDPRSRPRALFSIPGVAPTASQWAAGCRFHWRCPIARDPLGSGVEPPLLPEVPQGTGTVRCHLSGEPIATDAWRLADRPVP